MFSSTLGIIISLQFSYSAEWLHNITAGARFGSCKALALCSVSEKAKNVRYTARVPYIAHRITHLSGISSD